MAVSCCTSCTGVENQGSKEQVGFTENVSALDHIQKSDEQQECISQPHHDHQRCAGCRMLFNFFACHTLPP